MEIHFNNIKDEIIANLHLAKFNVFIAVAWTGDKEIINVLTKCVERGVVVEMVINNDNRFLQIKKYLKDFINVGGKIYLYDTKSSLMHNKFCIIDLCTTITGSYNWSFAANFHQENIIIEKENIQVAHKFALQHLLLKKNSTLFSNPKLNYPELVHSIKVDSYTIYNDENDGNGIILLLKEGNRSGVLEVKTNFTVDESFALNSVKGFWRSKLDVLTFGNDEGEEFYEFICVEPFYNQYIKY